MNDSNVGFVLNFPWYIDYKLFVYIFFYFNLHLKRKSLNCSFKFHSTFYINTLLQSLCLPLKKNPSKWFPYFTHLFSSQTHQYKRYLSHTDYFNIQLYSHTTRIQEITFHKWILINEKEKSSHQEEKILNKFFPQDALTHQTYSHVLDHIFPVNNKLKKK